MEDYIFVEGERYISAKKAAQETGYTSDYVGQMAREGRVDSKKVGRVRFVNEKQVKGYTVKSDRKKPASAKFRAATPETALNSSSEESTPPVVEENIPESTPSPVSAPEPVQAPESAPEEIPEPIVTPEHTPVVVEEPAEVGAPDLDKVLASAKDSVAAIPNTISKIDLNTAVNKVAALAVAVLVVASPYLWNKTDGFSMVTDSVGLTYENIKFDLEDVAVQIYEKTENDGAMRLITDSLSYSENKVINGLASAFYAYGRLDEIVAKTPEVIAEKGLELDIDVPAKALKASAIDSGKDLAKSVYEWFYIRGGE